MYTPAVADVIKRLQVENDLHCRADRLGIDRRSVVDIASRAIHDGVEVTPAGVRFPCETVDEYIQGRLRETAPHFFVSPPAPAPSASTDKISAADRLAMANGDDPVKL